MTIEEITSSIKLAYFLYRAITDPEKLAIELIEDYRNNPEPLQKMQELLSKKYKSDGIKLSVHDDGVSLALLNTELEVGEAMINDIIAMFNKVKVFIPEAYIPKATELILSIPIEYNTKSRETSIKIPISNKAVLEKLREVTI